MKPIRSGMVGIALILSACGNDDSAAATSPLKEAPAKDAPTKDEPVKTDPVTEPATKDAPLTLGESTPGCSKLALPTPNEYDVQVQLGTTLEAGNEGEFCAIQRVGDRDLWLNWSDTVLSVGSHHGLLWQSAYQGDLPETDSLGDPIELGKLRPCEGGANSRFRVMGVLAGSQGATNTTAKGVLPPDAALHIPANSYVVMNFHMINTTEDTLEPCMKVGIHSIDKAQVAKEAGVIFFYNSNIAIPAGEAATARMACPITQDISLKSAVSHMHRRGMGYDAELLSGDPYASDTHTVEMLYTTDEWDAPVDTIWTEPKQLQAGQYIDYACHYQNNETHDIAQGLDTTDEMCMFIGVYWPRNDGLSFCFDPKTGADTSYQIGSGKLDGKKFLSCVESSHLGAGAAENCGRAECADYGARFHLQNCFTQSCPAVGKYSQAYFNCLGANAETCGAECVGKAASCTLTCLNEQHCQAQVQALNDTACAE